MSRLLRGVKLPHKKGTLEGIVTKMPPPKKVVLSTAMHIGKPSEIIVKVGDEVKVGTLIANISGPISAPLHSSVSGKVTRIFEQLLANGQSGECIEIESDGQMESEKGIAPIEPKSKSEFIEALKNSGIIGLGGAGFPTFVKYNIPDGTEIDELIINGAECEPYITSDSAVMRDRAEDILYAIELILKFIPIKKVIIGIEANKPEATKKMQELSAQNSKISVQVLKTLYPQGGEKVLVYHTTGKVIKEGALPSSVGVIVSNVTTIAKIGEYFKTGMPLVRKVITVDGSAVAKPQNIDVAVGTPLSDVFDFCGGFAKEPKRVIYGGPMMGVSVPFLDRGVLKNTNAVLALTREDVHPIQTTNCIRCGACTNHCPFGINPAEIARAFEKEDKEELLRIGTNLCMECGCCSYICPANRPLVQTNRLAKKFLKI